MPMQYLIERRNEHGRIHICRSNIFNWLLFRISVRKEWNMSIYEDDIFYYGVTKPYIDRMPTVIPADKDGET
jgi:hypothetical protein